MKQEKVFAWFVLFNEGGGSYDFIFSVHPNIRDQPGSREETLNGSQHNSGGELQGDFTVTPKLRL